MTSQAIAAEQGRSRRTERSSAGEEYTLSRGSTHTLYKLLVMGTWYMQWYFSKICKISSLIFLQ